MTNEPVLSAGVIAGAIGAVLVALVSLGVIQLSPDQQTAVMAAIVAVLPIAFAAIARDKVTPLTRPRDDTGTPLVRIDGAKPVVEE
jgi:hypothetical protein